ncbi:MAG TPA: iron chelate uptake ABC transporter family permease subunit [Burkholderiaceae bacterium]|nr:iron chelate uptake ABC transporter family permease subunit [Burkholderiaceae bacterium]
MKSLTPSRLAWMLAATTLGVLVLALSAGPDGWSFALGEDAWLISQIRAPRAIGAWVAGALLGLAGAIAQGVFRNPLADPYLLGSAAGAGLGLVLALAAGGLAGAPFMLASVSAWARLGLVGAAFAGALLGVGLTLVLARGAARPTVLLLAGVVVGVVLSALADLVMLVSPEALRGKQAFLLGTTSFLSWNGVTALAIVLALALPLAVALGRAIDALALGEASAASLGVPVPVVRLALVALMALCTACAVAHGGLIAFVGLVSSHLVRRCVVTTHRAHLMLATLAGGALLASADLAARVVIAPQELPVGVLTAILGGGYLTWLLRRRTAP